MVSYKSTNCVLGMHQDCALATQCKCYCHDMEKRKIELEHYKTLDCKWGKHSDCRDEMRRCSCECHR